MTDPASPLSVSLRDYLERVLIERIDGNDKRYAERFTAQSELFAGTVAAQDKAVQAALAASEKAVQAAFSASEKAVQAAFLASEKASAKAEEAQTSYNERSNEFRGQLDDQAKTLMPRSEATALLKAQDDKIEALTRTLQELRFGIAGTSGAAGAAMLGTAHDQQRSDWRTGMLIGGAGVVVAVLGVVAAVVALVTR